MVNYNPFVMAYQVFLFKDYQNLKGSDSWIRFINSSNTESECNVREITTPGNGLSLVTFRHIGQGKELLIWKQTNTLTAYWFPKIPENQLRFILETHPLSISQIQSCEEINEKLLQSGTTVIQSNQKRKLGKPRKYDQNRSSSKDEIRTGKMNAKLNDSEYLEVPKESPTEDGDSTFNMTSVLNYIKTEDLPDDRISSDIPMDSVAWPSTGSLNDTFTSINYPSSSSQTRNSASQNVGKKRKHYVKPSAKCPVCNQVFRRGHINKHIARAHKLGNAFNCKDCNIFFIDQELLTKHLETHDDQRRYRKVNYESGVVYECLECGLSFGNHICVKMHLDKHSVTKPPSVNKTQYLKCDFCGDCLSKDNVEAISLHVTMHKPLMECCGERFFDEKLFLDHVGTHGKKSFPCFCGAQFWNKMCLNLHKNKHITNNDYYKCEECGEMFMKSCENSIAKHKRKHQTRHYCKLCNIWHRKRWKCKDQSISNAKMQKNHVRTNRKEKMNK